MFPLIWKPPNLSPNQLGSFGHHGESHIYSLRSPLSQTLAGKILPPLVIDDLSLDGTSLHLSSPEKLRTGSGPDKRDQMAPLPAFDVNISPIEADWPASLSSI